MNDKLRIIIGLILYLAMPVLMAYIIAKLFMKNEGKILFIIFITLIILEIIAVIIKVVRYNKNK